MGMINLILIGIFIGMFIGVVTLSVVSWVFSDEQNELSHGGVSRRVHNVERRSCAEHPSRCQEAFAVEALQETIMARTGLGNDLNRNRELAKRHGGALISALRRTYGRSFAPGMPENERLMDVIHQLDERSLSKLDRDNRGP